MPSHSHGMPNRCCGELLLLVNSAREVEVEASQDGPAKRKGGQGWFITATSRRPSGCRMTIHASATGSRVPLSTATSTVPVPASRVAVVACIRQVAPHCFSSPLGDDVRAGPRGQAPKGHAGARMYSLIARYLRLRAASHAPRRYRDGITLPRRAAGAAAP